MQPADESPLASEADQSEWETCTSPGRYYSALAIRLSFRSVDEAVEAFLTEHALERLPELEVLLADRQSYEAWLVATRSLEDLAEKWIAYVRREFRRECMPKFQWVGAAENKSRRAIPGDAIEHSFSLGDLFNF